MKYIGYFYEYDNNGEIVDDFKEWCNADSKIEAVAEFQSRCGHNVRLDMVMEG